MTEACLTFDGFNKMFEKKIRIVDTYEKAYNEVENYHSERFGDRKYSDYQSFRQVRNKKIRK